MPRQMIEVVSSLFTLVDHVGSIEQLALYSQRTVTVLPWDLLDIAEFMVAQTSI